MKYGQRLLFGFCYVVRYSIKIHWIWINWESSSGIALMNCVFYTNQFAAFCVSFVATLLLKCFVAIIFAICLLWFMMGCFLSIFDEWMFKILKAIFGLGNGFIVWDRPDQIWKTPRPNSLDPPHHPIPAKVVQMQAQRVSIGIFVFDNHEFMICVSQGLDPIKLSLVYLLSPRRCCTFHTVPWRCDELMSHIHVLATQPFVITIKNCDGSEDTKLDPIQTL